MFGAVFLVACVAAALYYAMSHPNRSAYPAVSEIPDVFGFGTRALRRSTKRATRKTEC